MTPDPLQTTLAYHQRSKHSFEAYAPGPATLDWDAQPAPFRHFEGSASIALPPLADALQDASLKHALQRPWNEISQPAPAIIPDLNALSVLFQLSLGITAWKTFGPDRWAVRANPSSGNLHPVEGYAFLRGITGVPDGLYHYCPDTHTLECRASFESAPNLEPPLLLLGLSCLMWREAWKYGERAFRYCQLDTGHAIGALRYATLLLGWPLTEIRQVSGASLAHWLGLDRATDFPIARSGTNEREEAEILLSMSPLAFDTAALEQACSTAHWHGLASRIDQHPMYDWPVIEAVALATRQQAQTEAPTPIVPDIVPEIVPAPLPGVSIPASRLILQRRSAQRFDVRHNMPQQDFFSLLTALLPSEPGPWNALAMPPHISLVLLVHRVEGLQPGLYLLPRTAQLSALLHTALDQRFLCTPLIEAPPLLDLQRLSSVPTTELYRSARSLNCHQDIAANACFALGMLAEFDSAVSADPAAYRDLYREAGLLGQALYLEAEGRGLRGTGIGCYFDDAFHQLIGLTDNQSQSLYHFTVGLPLDDQRIETSLPFDLAPTP